MRPAVSFLALAHALRAVPRANGFAPATALAQGGARQGGQWLPATGVARGAGRQAAHWMSTQENSDVNAKLVAFGGKPIFKYLDLPIAARGGALRFFLLYHGIDFESSLFKPKTEWPAEKKRMVESGENPAGNVPVVLLGDKTLTQHIATMRYLARVAGITTGEAYGDFVQDAVADEYQGWRNDFVGAAFGPDEGKALYREGLPDRLGVFEALYTKYKTGSGPFLSTSPAGKGLWGDTAVFGLLWDHVKRGFLTAEQLDEYPNLRDLYGAYMAESAIAAWVSSKEG